MTQTKILILTSDSSIGGAERTIFNLATSVDSTRFLVEAATLRDTGPLLRYLNEKGIRTYTAGFRGKWDTSGFLRLKRLIDESDPDILHTFLFHANISGRLIGALTGVSRIISSQRGIDKWRKPWHNLADRITARSCWKTVAVSDAARSVLVNRVGIPASSVVVIHNGVDLDAFSPGKGKYRSFGDSSGEMTIGCVANLRRVKGHEVLLEACRMLHHDGLGFRLLLIGEGVLRKKLEHKAHALGIAGNTVFMGKVEDVPAILPTLDVFVLPSFEEGFPTSVLEAMASGVPVVATDVGGTGEMIRSEENGILVPPGDSRALAAGIGKLAFDAPLAEKLAANARRTVTERFSIRRMVREYEELYHEAMSSLPPI